jgi:hypothetical protein
MRRPSADPLRPLPAFKKARGYRHQKPWTTDQQQT